MIIHHFKHPGDGKLITHQQPALLSAGCLVTEWCPILCNHMDYSPPGSSVHGDPPGENTGVGCHALLQEIFPTKGLNPGLMHCRQILYCLSHKGNHQILINLWDDLVPRQVSKVVILKCFNFRKLETLKTSKTQRNFVYVE